MWDILTSSAHYWWNWAIDFASTTTATFLLLGAMAFYVYTLIDARVPRVVIAPVVGVLCFASAWIFSKQDTQVYERQQCEVRNSAALKDLNDKYLSAATALQGLQSKYNADRVALEQQHSEERSDLLDSIKRLEAAEDEANAKLEAEQSKNEQSPAIVTAPQSRPSVVYVPSSRCFSTTVPDDVLRSINKAGRGK
jgi:hypothetical protein